MQNRSCFTRKQTCNGEYMKHCTRSRHQLKMAAPAEVSEKRSNFRIRQFKEKRLFNIAANLTLNTMASFFILLIACTARIAWSDRHIIIYRQTDTHTRQLLYKVQSIISALFGMIIQYTIIQYTNDNTIQYTLQYNTIHYNTIQYTIQYTNA